MQRRVVMVTALFLWSTGLAFDAGLFRFHAIDCGQVVQIK